MDKENWVLLQSKNVVTVTDIISVLGWDDRADFADTTKVVVAFAEFCRTSERNSWDGKTLDLVKETRSRNIEGDGGIKALVGLLEEGHLDGICDLRVWLGYEVTQESMRRFCNLLQSGRLNHLQSLHFHSLVRRRTAKTAWEEFDKSLPSADLRDLRIFDYGLAFDSGDPTSGEKLASILANQFALGHLHSLRALFLELHDMRDEGVMSLAKSFEDGHAEKLEQLGLTRSYIGNKGAESLAAALERGKCPKLNCLDLRENHIGSEGLVALAKAFKSGHLSKLDYVGVPQRITLDFDKAGMMEIVGALEAGSLPCLTMMKLTDGVDEFGFGGFPMVVKGAIENAYRRNPYLIASLWDVHSDFDPWVRRVHQLQRSNEKRVQRFKELQNEEDVAGQHGKIFFCGDPRVRKTTLRITLTAEKVTMMNKTCGLFCAVAPPKEQESTRGIEVTHLQAEGVTLALWDLAGQNDYEVLHSAFMPDLKFADGQATIFVIVCKAESFDKAKSQLGYWMRFISSNSLKKTKRPRRVFVVLNCFHGHGIPTVEVPRWKDLLKECEKGFEMYLNVSTELFIANVRSRTEVQSFKSTILHEAKKMLKSRKMPQICHSVQEEGRRWMQRQENLNYPVLTWREFRNNLGGNRLLEEKKLEVAAEYLHEAGHIILFRKVISSSALEGEKLSFRLEGEKPPSTLEGEKSPSALEGEGFTLQESLVIVDPEWFCKQVVGNLLLPGDVAHRDEVRLDILQEERGASIPISTLEKYEFQVPKEKVDQVVVILSRLGICYRIKDRADVMFVPALIREVGEPAWPPEALQNDIGTGAWVMGFSLRVKNLKATLLPVNVLRQLQVNIAVDESIGGRPDQGYLARKFSVSFKFKLMCVLIEYSKKQDRIDVLVKPSVNGLSRKEQVNIAQEFVNMIKKIVYHCAPGVELDKRIIQPWSAADRWQPIEKRDIQTSVDTVTTGVEKRGNLGWMGWPLRQEAIGEGDVLSDEDLRNFLGIIHRKMELTKESVNCLTNPNKEELSKCEGTSSSSEASNVELSNANFKHKDQSLVEVLREVLIPFMEKKFASLRAGQRDILKTHKRSHIEMMQLMQDVKGNISKILEKQSAFNVQIQNLERFSVERRELSIPRFAFVTKKGERSWQMKLTKCMVETSLLRFLCEAKYEDGAKDEIGTFHEVDHAKQEGIDVRKISNWAKKLLPILVWTLKVTFVAAKIAGNATLPGLGILFGNDQELSGILDKAMVMVTDAAELAKYVFEALDDFGQQSVLNNSGESVQGGSSSSSWVPGNETQLRGDAKEAVGKLLNKMDNTEKMQKVGLIRVWLKSSDSSGEKHVAWICQECYDSYTRQNPPRARAV